MTTINLKIENLNQFIRAMEEAPQITTKYLQKSVQRSVVWFHARAKANSPVDKSALKNSHVFTVGRLKGEIYPTVGYAGWVHDGHKQEVGRFVPAIGKRLVNPFVKGQPWFVDTMNQEAGKINDIFDTELGNALDEIARKSQ